MRRALVLLANSDHFTPRLFGPAIASNEDAGVDIIVPIERCICPTGKQIAERRFVQRLWLDNSSRRQLFNDHLDEPNLRQRQAPVFEQANPPQTI